MFRNFRNIGASLGRRIKIQAGIPAATNMLLHLDANNTTSYPGTGSTWYDISGNTNNTTSTTGTTFVNNQEGKYFDFNGTSGVFVTSAAKYNVTYTGKTVFISAKLSSAMMNNSYRCLFGNTNLRNFNVYLFRDTSGVYKLHYSQNSLGGFSNAVNISVGSWFTAAVTHTTSGAVTYYFNGGVVGNGTASFYQWQTSSGEQIGASDNYWIGGINLVTVYGSALSSQQIMASHIAASSKAPAHVASSNLILHYDPSNPLSYPGSGTTINNLASSSHPGTMSNITASANYFTYNGTNSQISVADDAALEPGSGSWTVEAWVNQSVTGNDVVLGKFNNGGAAQNVGYSIRTTGAVHYAQYGSGSGSGSTLYQNSSNLSATSNTWYQLVYVWTNGGTKTFETFVNGAIVGSVSHSLSSVLNTNTPLYIGSYNGGEYAQWYDGKIGIVRIYNTALTSAQILQNYNADKAKYGL